MPVITPSRKQCDGFNNAARVQFVCWRFRNGEFVEGHSLKKRRKKLGLSASDNSSARETESAKRVVIKPLVWVEGRNPKTKEPEWFGLGVLLHWTGAEFGLTRQF